jgi:micrococcal nuclease
MRTSVKRRQLLAATICTFVCVTIGQHRTAANRPTHRADAELLKVERVIDGDTIVAEEIGRVRLIGVDTPESVHPRQQVQEFAAKAAAFLRNLVEGRYVRLEFESVRRDRYGRTLAYVFLSDGTLVNEEIIRCGYGFAYTRSPFKHVERFRRLERKAHESGAGLWGRR